MYHKATIKNDPNQPYRQFLASCSCGPQGNFTKKEDARGFLEFHLNRFNNGVDTKEFVDETEPLPAGSESQPEAKAAETLGDA